MACKLCTSLLLIVCLAHLCLSVPLEDFYPFGADSIDESTSSMSNIQLTNAITIRVDVDGSDCQTNAITSNISIGGKLNMYNPLGDFAGLPQLTFDLLTLSTADIDSHTVYYLTVGEFPAEFRDKLFAPFKESFRNYSRFDPTSYTQITWALEHSFGSSVDIQPLFNTFQLFLASNGTFSMVVYLYADDQLQWGNSSSNEYASMGINVCSSSYVHPSSLTPGLPNDLVTGSNVNIPGMWMFMIRNGELILPVPCSVGCSFETGTCNEPNTCSCFNGWEGENCTTPSCPNGCVNGICSEPFVCTCDNGWLEDDCSVAACRNSCRNGMCEVPYVCSCVGGWEDENCSTPICSTPCVNGTCIAPNECDCFDGYRGEFCEVPICLGGSDCMGSCSVPGECVCEDGYSGVLCDVMNETPTDGGPSDDDDGGSQTGLSGAAVGGIVGGIIGFFILAVLLVFFIGCVLFYFLF